MQECHSGSLVRQGSSTYTSQMCPSVLEWFNNNNHDGGICKTNSWELMAVFLSCRGRLCPGSPVCLPLCWLTRPGWFTSKHWRHSHILQRWAEHSSGCRHSVLLTCVVHKFSCLSNACCSSLHNLDLSYSCCMLEVLRAGAVRRDFRSWKWRIRHWLLRLVARDCHRNTYFVPLLAWIYWTTNNIFDRKQDMKMLFLGALTLKKLKTKLLIFWLRCVCCLTILLLS